MRRVTPVDDYLAALAAELALLPPSAIAAQPVDTIYLGGGTPSRLGGDGVARVIDVVTRHFPPAADAEVTLEANPDDVSAEAVRAWRAAGINRVSLGVQSFDDRTLQWMHRTHDADAARSAAKVLADGGIANWSIDLIFAVTEHLDRSWERDVAEGIGLGPSHVSLYGLTVEDRTPLARWQERGTVVAADEDAYEREYVHAHQALTASGFDHYEVSNFGRPARWSRHNGGYWSGVPYVGLGPGAHGYDGATRSWNDREYAKWRARALRGERPLAGAETLTAENRISEAVYLGLRTSAGVDLSQSELEAVKPWVREGWAEVDSGRLRLTPAGWLRLDSLAASLTSLRSR